jgi:hypothetical protein
MVETSMKVLNYPYTSENIFTNVLSNYKFYAPKQIDDANRPFVFPPNIGKGLFENYTDFVSSTPSILCMKKDEYIVNVRFVNYTIDGNGNYVNKENIITHNVIAVLDSNGFILQEFLLDYEREMDGHYIGLEDVRLLLIEDANKRAVIRYSANRGLGNGEKMCVEIGEISLDDKKTVNSMLLESPENRAIEKNWCLFADANTNDIRIVYSWSPLIIGVVKKESANFVETHRFTNVPSCMRNLRGSSNGIIIGDEIWFLAHTVNYEERRYYYHIWVVLDASTYEVRKCSPFFTFEGEKVEYTLGFVYDESANEFIVGYSVLDKTTHCIRIANPFDF